MSATAHPLGPAWIRGHVVVLLLSVVVLALAATVVVLALRVADEGPATVPATSVQVTDDGCLGARPGAPC